jgi:ubiquinone biosynthesis protein COQ9
MSEEHWASAAEQRVLDEALALAPATGWTWRTALAAGTAAGFSKGETELLLPRGPADLAALLSRRHDAAALAALAGIDPKSLKMRERIKAAVMARIDAAAGDEAALKSWAGFLALPTNMALGLRLSWESADALWCWAGDTATDENHYSKRAILAGILTGALAIRLKPGREDAEAFVDARIGGVMAFEKWKAGLTPRDLLSSVAGALGKLRYG